MSQALGWLDAVPISNAHRDPQSGALAGPESAATPAPRPARDRGHPARRRPPDLDCIRESRDSIMRDMAMHARTSSSGVASETLLAGCLGSEDATAGGGVPRHARFKHRRLYVLHDRRLAAGGDCCRNDEYAAADAAIVEPRREPAGVLVHHQATGKDACSLHEGRRAAQSKRCNSGGASRLLALLSGCLAPPLGRDPVIWHAFEYEEHKFYRVS